MMGGYAQAVQQKSAMDMLQRNFLASQYDNVINAPLPDQQKDPEGYQKALDAKAKALEARQKVYSPDHHANLFDAIHGLITGRQEGAQPQSGAPVSTATPQALGAPPAANGDLSTQHPMTPLPAGHPLNKIEEGIKALGQHLKAAAHPIAPKPGPDWMSLAAAPTPEQVKQSEALQLQRQRDAAALERAKIAASGKPVNKYTLGLTKYAESLGKSVDDLTDAEVTTFDKQFAAANKAPATPSQAALSVYLRAKYGDNPTAEQIAEGTAEHQKLMAGVTVGSHQQLVFDDQGVPHVVTLESKSGKQFPVPSTSPQVPDLQTVNAGIAAGNAASKKLNKGKPVSSKSPVLDFTKGSPTAKSDAAQYTKVAEDANNKRQAYESARRALVSGSTPSSDQELIYSWVRSNVQGAGRMTQAEFKQAASVGSLPQRAQNWYNLTLKGTLAPSIEQMMLADIKRSSEVADAEAADLRSRISGPKSSTSPQVPGSDDLRERLLKAVQ